MLALQRRRFAVLIALAATLLFRPSASVAASDDAVTFLCNPTHNALSTTPKLGTPLTKLWSVDLGADVSYPLIAQGLVFVTVGDNAHNSSYGTKLYALNAQTGSVVWGPVNLGGTYYFGACAYDAGKVFAVNFDGLLRSFNAATGVPGWSLQLPGQYAFSSPPTAVNGVIYIGGAGSGGTLYAVDESSGAVLWTKSVENGDDSSPVVTDDAVYVSYAGPQTYKFDLSGNLLWHYDGGAEGGGGSTPVLYDGQLYVRDAVVQYDGNYVDGLVLSSSSGALLNAFGPGYSNYQSPPVFDNGVGVFADSSGNIQAQDVTSGTALWSFSNGSDTITTTPLIINANVFVGTTSGKLIALNEATGQTVWSTNVGAGIPAASMAAGDSLLAIPAGTTLVVYAASATTPTPATLKLASALTRPSTSVLATVQLSANAPTGGTTITLASSDTGYATVPASVTVMAGARTASFPVTVGATIPPYNHHLTVSATAGGVTLSAPLAVQSLPWKALALAVGPDGMKRVLWDRTDGSMMLWTLNADGSKASQTVTFGPYAGWTPKALSVGPDNAAHVLWTNTDGRMTLWTFPANNAAPTFGPYYGPIAGWTAVSVATTPDNNNHVLWNRTDGAMTLWTLPANGSAPSYSPVYGPFAGWTARANAAGLNNAAHVLWVNTHGAMTLWTLPPDGSAATYSPVYGPYANWTPTALSMGSDGASHVLWDNTNGAMTLWDLPANGSTPSYSPVFGPYTGWSAVGVSIDADGNSDVLWDNVDGRITPWTLDTSNQFVGTFPVYGPL